MSRNNTVLELYAICKQLEAEHRYDDALRAWDTLLLAIEEEHSELTQLCLGELLMKSAGKDCTDKE